jgi:hypothetical protein
MTDEIEALLARARQLEEENALLRSMQSPGGDHAALQAENVMLRGELDRVREASRAAAPQPETTDAPRTLEQFNALPPPQRQAVAQKMSRQQRDELLGRSQARKDRKVYL